MKHVDALVLTSFAGVIGNDPPRFERQDLPRMLEEIQRTDGQQPSGAPFGEKDRQNVLASAVFLRIGKVVTDRVLRLDGTSDEPVNPYLDRTHVVVDSISPYVPDEDIPLEAYALTRLHENPRVQQESSLTDVVEEIIPGYLKDKDQEEFMAKMQIATEVYRARGEVEAEFYDIDELLGVFRRYDTEAVAPDKVYFDEDLNVKAEVHNLGDIVNRSGLTKITRRVPYYETFRTLKNGTVMLGRALDDIETLGTRLRAADT